MAGKLAVTEIVGTDVLVDLKRLGFTEYEARVYVQLLRQSPATAYEVSKSSNVPRPNTYHALDALAQRAAVLPVSENPVRYVAADPQSLLDAISGQTRSLCSDLALRLSAISPAADDQYVWTLQGDQAVHEKIEALINGSQRSLWIKAADDVLRRHKKALRLAAERGVETLIVLFGFDADEFRFTENCRVYIHEGNGVRMGTADNLFTLAVDHVEMLTAALDQEVVAAHIPATGRSLPWQPRSSGTTITWRRSSDRFGPEIDEAFGPHLRDLRVACFSPEQVECFMRRTGLAEKVPSA